MPREPGDPADVRLLVREDERDAHSAPPRTTRATDAVDVPRVLRRGVEVDDVRDVDEVETAGSEAITAPKMLE